MKKLEDFNLFPSPLGIVSTKGENSTLNIKSYLMGDRYAEVFSNGLKYSAAQKLNLAQNRLKPNGGVQILKGINPQVREIDLSDNSLGENNECINQLVSRIIQDKRFIIETLVLDSYRITEA